MVKFLPFSEVRKNLKLLEYGNVIYDFEARDVKIPIV